jgi:two-component system, chemotaxis family, chemotaxis protein CheY
MPKTVLIVDDSPSLRELVAFTVKGAGFDVIQGANGQEALDRLQGQQVQVVITDLNMPVMDGFALTRQLRSNPLHKFTPILMLTTESQGAKKQAGKEAGVTGWIVKPFNPQQMLAILSKYVR